MAGRENGRLFVIGVVSDTHGLLRPAVVKAFAGVDLIVHAGDIGDGVLEDLGKTARCVAVLGNTDREYLMPGLHRTERVAFQGKRIFVIHDLAGLDYNPIPPGTDIVIFGHSHQAEIRHDKGILFFNPGSAGPRRFRLPVTVGIIEIDTVAVRPRIVKIDE